MGRHIVAPLRELPPGARKIVTIEGRSIGVFNIEGSLFAIRNSCPHQGAPLCLGWVSGTTLPGKPYEKVYGRDNEIIKCPWHGWEFEISSGKSIFNPHRVRVKTYEVTIEEADRIELRDDVTVETFQVTVEDEFVILHV